MKFSLQNGDRMKRPPTSIVAKRESYRLANGKCGCGCGKPLPPFGTKRGIIYDHNPPLAMRERNPYSGRYTPDADDPAHLKPLLPDCDKRKTHGKRGEKHVTTRGSDLGEIRRMKDLRDSHASHLQTMRDKKPGQGRKPKGQIKSRGFSTEKRPFRGKF